MKEISSFHSGQLVELATTVSPCKNTETQTNQKIEPCSSFNVKLEINLENWIKKTNDDE